MSLKDKQLKYKSCSVRCLKEKGHLHNGILECWIKQSYVILNSTVLKELLEIQYHINLKAQTT